MTRSLVARARINGGVAIAGGHRAWTMRPPFATVAATMFAALGAALVVAVALGLDAAAIASVDRLPPAVKALFQWATRYGKSDWLLVPAASVMIVVGLGDWRAVSRVNAAAWHEIAALAGILFLVVALSGIATDVVKPLVGRVRPGFASGPFDFSPLSFAGYRHYSFPSGHATTAAAVATLALYVRGSWTVAVVAAAGVVAVSRVAIGAHWPSDVVGGVFVGVGVSWLVLRASVAAGVGLRALPDGRVRWRTGVLRRIRRSRFALFPGLWLALRGGG
jgi:undecaprenyl-diphosphatase